jgi:hypothetical protein
LNAAVEHWGEVVDGATYVKSVSCAFLSDALKVAEVRFAVGLLVHINEAAVIPAHPDAVVVVTTLRGSESRVVTRTISGSGGDVCGDAQVRNSIAAGLGSDRLTKTVRTEIVDSSGELIARF